MERNNDPKVRENPTMQFLTLKEVLALPPGTPVPATAGTIKDLSAYQSGTNEHGPWSIQNAFIEDDSGSLPMKIGNQAEIPRTMIGQTLFFLAHKKTKGGLSGLKADMEEWSEEGKVKPYTILAMAKSGEMLTEAQFAERMKTEVATQPPQTTALPLQNTTPQQQNMVPVVQNAIPPAQNVVVPTAPVITEVRHENKGPVGYRVTEIHYEKKVYTGNYCSESLGVTLQVEPGQGAAAVDAAKAFCVKHLPPEFIGPGKPVK